MAVLALVDTSAINTTPSWRTWVQGRADKHVHSFSERKNFEINLNATVWYYRLQDLGIQTRAIITAWALVVQVSPKLSEESAGSRTKDARVRYDIY